MSASRSTETCAFDGCGRRVWSRGLCNSHAWQRRKGKALTSLQRRGTDPVIEFDEVPCVKAGLDGPCHVFRGGKSHGYGLVSLRGKMVRVHRYVWEQSRGRIPEHLEIDHVCRNKACCNVRHLRAVPHQVNATENVEGAAWQLMSAKTHCPQGHEYSRENTCVSGGRRHCRACGRIRDAKRRAERRRLMGDRPKENR